MLYMCYHTQFATILMKNFEITFLRISPVVSFFLQYLCLALSARIVAAPKMTSEVCPSKFCNSLEIRSTSSLQKNRIRFVNCSARAENQLLAGGSRHCVNDNKRQEGWMA